MNTFRYFIGILSYSYLLKYKLINIADVEKKSSKFTENVQYDKGKECLNSAVSRCFITDFTTNSRITP